jgi:hypothetical protein
MPARRRRWFRRERPGAWLAGRDSGRGDAVRLADTPRLVLLSMAGLRAAGFRAAPSRVESTQWPLRSVRNAHLLTVAGAAQVGLAASGATPVSRFTGGHAPGTINAGQSIAGMAAVDRAVRVMACRSRCYDSRMLDDLDQLAGKITELARLVHSLRSENQQLRAQLAAVSAEHESMRGRVEEASRRLDRLMERLPAPAAASVPWNT